MKHTVLIPAWRRGDMLHACLTRLEKAATDDVTVVVSLDRGSTQECREVAESFSGLFRNLYLRVMHSHQFHGNSYNILSGIKDVMNLGGDLIHIVEEDILVSLGYFVFHEAAHESAPEAFAVSACRNQNLTGAAPAAAYRHSSYQSLGISFRPDTATRAVEHEKASYYGDMSGYCKRNWPGTLIPHAHAEQDGVFNRIRESAGLKTVYTSRPRAFHAGFHGYNRPGARLFGSLEERSARILAMSSEEMNSLAGAIKDHEVIDLDELLPVTEERKALKSDTSA